MAPTSSPLTAKAPSQIRRHRSRPSLSVNICPPTAARPRAIPHSSLGASTHRSIRSGSTSPTRAGSPFDSPKPGPPPKGPSPPKSRLSVSTTTSPDMSRIPSVSTPGRHGTPPTPGSGIPTPSARRPRSSLGPASGRASLSVSGNDEDAMGHLQEALRARPPSSMRHLLEKGNDPHTPTSFGLAAPRTPLARSRTPSGAPLKASVGPPITPGAARVRARPSIGLGASTTTPRKPSLAASTTTPYRPESRASVATDKFDPHIGDKVRMQSMGMEGTLRFLGTTEFRDGIWAGVELEGGFAGKGKNDGSVEGIAYFTCPPQCGVFILASRLSAPTACSRPVSVASHHSRASISGRMTPAENRIRPSTTTPGRATRTVSVSTPGRTTLGNSTSSNVKTPTVTAGSRASKYVGMTAKQLSEKSGPPVSGLSVSVRGMSTPKARGRPSIGTTATPLRARQSIGGATPRARPRQSEEAMPPPPSPGKVRVMAQAAQLEAELRHLKSRNEELESKLLNMHQTDDDARSEISASPDLEALRTDIEIAQKEADELRHHLAQTQEDARLAADMAEELLEKEKEYENEIESLKKRLEGTERNAEEEKERQREKNEMEAVLEKKGEMVKTLQERCKGLEEELSEAEGNVEELRAAGQATISLYEQKLSDTETRTYELEDRIRSLEDKLAKSESEVLRLESLASSTSAPAPTGASAAEIDNETLQTQLKHLTSKISTLEEHLDESRAQLESEADGWKARLEKAKQGEREKGEQVRELQGEVKKMRDEQKGAKGRMGEMEVALQEVRGALEGARGEIEGLRGEAGEASNLRTALAKSADVEKSLAEQTALVKTLEEKVAMMEEMKKDCQRFEAQVATLQAELASAQRKSPQLNNNLALPSTPDPDRLAPSAPSSSASALGFTEGGNSPIPGSPSRRNYEYARPRLSTGTQEGDEQKMHGYHHVIRELTADNAALKKEVGGLKEEVKGLKEEVKLMEELGAEGESGDVEGRKKDKATIKDLEREVSELESLIESKIYQQDDLETQITRLEKQLREAKSNSNSAINPGYVAPGGLIDLTKSRARAGNSASPSPAPALIRSKSGASGITVLSGTSAGEEWHDAYAGIEGEGQSRGPSRGLERDDVSEISDAGKGEKNERVGADASAGARAGAESDTDERCELCEGPHELDQCPVFAGNLDAAPSGMGRRRCADCDSTEHDTADCPLADDVF